MSSKDNRDSNISNELRLQAAALYLDEWKHRDDVYNKYCTTFYFCSVVVSLFPYVEFKENNIQINEIVFALAGILIAFLTTMTISLMAKRNVIVSKKYRELVECIPVDCDEANIKKGNVISRKLPWWIFGIICVMNVIMVIQNLIPAPTP